VCGALSISVIADADEYLLTFAVMTYDCIIIGGGIVGLSTAYQISKKNPSLRILVLEKEATLAAHQTGHNSGVIHSGIYYKPGSLKAKNCLDGYDMLLQFAREYGIRHELCGKVIVATSPAEIPQLEMIYKRGHDNGLDKITMISAEELKEIEPHCNGVKAIRVPYTGIIDYKAVANKLGELIKEAGSEIQLGTKVDSIVEEGGSVTVGAGNQSFSTRLAINCAGLYSDKIAGLTDNNINVRIIPFRGEYFMIRPERQHLVNHLIYPVPDPAFPFLGVHFTRMVGGGVEAGPNAVFAFKREGYKKTDFNFSELMESLAWPGFRKVAMKYWKTGAGEFYRSFSKQAFTKALQRLVPDIREEDLTPAGAGVRAQACDKTGGLIDDFLFLEKKSVIHVLNAPSPAATSSLSIGKTISNMALQRL
jgi:L-2-hydroxyglutarate oxidase